MPESDREKCCPITMDAGNESMLGGADRGGTRPTCSVDLAGEVTDKSFAALLALEDFRTGAATTGDEFLEGDVEGPCEARLFRSGKESPRVTGEGFEDTLVAKLIGISVAPMSRHNPRKVSASSADVDRAASLSGVRILKLLDRGVAEALRFLPRCPGVASESSDGLRFLGFIGKGRRF